MRAKPGARTVKIFETEWFTLESIPFKSPSRAPYYRINCPDSVEILALTTEHKVILVRQFRPAIGAKILELPSGYVDRGETRRQAAQRELREETGYASTTLIFLGTFTAAPDRINNRVDAFFAADARRLPGHKPEAGLVLAAPRNLDRMILNQGFRSVSGIGLFSLAKLKGLI